MTYIKYSEYLKLENKDGYQPVLNLEEHESLKGNMPKFSITVSQLSVEELNKMEQDEINI